MADSSHPSLKIGLVLDDSLDTADGVQQYIMTLSAWLKAQGHDVHFLVGETKRTDIPQVHSLSRNIKVRFNKNRMSMPLPASKTKLRALLEREQFDVLHIQLPYSPFLAGRIIKAAPAKTAVVGTFHVAPHSRVVHFANRALRILTRRSLPRFDAVMSVSRVAQAFARQTFKITSAVVPNTIDTTPYRDAKPFPQYNDEITIVSLGRLVERKGCQYLLRAIVRLEKEKLAKHPYKVIICGKGPLETSLKAYAKAHHIDHLIEFTGFIAEAAKPRYLASADIAVYPSTGGESFGIVLIEAMAAARGAVLAGDNPGYASVMETYPDALFNPHNTKAFTQKLADLLNSPAARKRAHAWQKKEVAQYDVAEVGKQVVAQYIQALHKRAQ